MDIVKEGDKVQLVCEAKLEDGTTCFKNEQENPLVFIVGEGSIFPAIEKQVKDMKQGETKTVLLKPEEAFGNYREDLVVAVPKSKVQTDNDLDIDSKVNLKMSSGEELTGIVTENKEDTITVDFNHPLVDKKIIFTLTIKHIEKS